MKWPSGRRDNRVRICKEAVIAAAAKWLWTNSLSAGMVPVCVGRVSRMRQHKGGCTTLLFPFRQGQAAIPSAGSSCGTGMSPSKHSNKQLLWRKSAEGQGGEFRLLSSPSHQVLDIKHISFGKWDGSLPLPGENLVKAHQVPEKDPAKVACSVSQGNTQGTKRDTGSLGTAGLGCAHCLPKGWAGTMHTRTASRTVPLPGSCHH